MRTQLSIAASALVALCGTAAGQSVIGRHMIAQGSPTNKWGEVAIQASPLDDYDVAVAFCGSPSATHVVTTRTGFAGFSSPPPAPQALPGAASCGQPSADPGLCGSASTGDIFLSCLNSGVPIYRKALHEEFTSWQQAVDCNHPECAFWEKPFIAMGPWPSGGPHAVAESIVVGTYNASPRPPYNIGGCAPPYPPGQSSCLLYAVYTAHSLDAAPQGMVWSVTPGENGYATQVDGASSARDNPCASLEPGQPTTLRMYGYEAYPLVLPSGRALLGFTDFGIPCAGPVSMPTVTYSDTLGDPGAGGRRWQPAQQISKYGPNNLDIFAPIGAAWTPSLDYNPFNPNEVVFAFVGRDSSTAISNDIFLAQSTTGGAPPNQTTLGFPTSRTVRITETMLTGAGIPAGFTSKHHVSVAFDFWGGVNVLYYCMEPSQPAEDSNTQVRLAHWTSYDEVILQHTATVLVLSGLFSPWGTGGRFDYAMLKRAGCRLYAAYPTSESNTWDMYVSIIDPRSSPYQACAIADSDGNAAVNSADLALFLSAFSQGAPLADADHSGAVTVDDAVLYLSAYAANAPP